MSSYIWHKLFIQTVKYSFFNQIIVYQVSRAGCSCLVIFYFNSSVFRLARVSKSLARCLLSVPTTLTKKLYLWFCLTQIVHSNGSHFVILIFLRGKLCVLACISKSLAWTVFPCVKKMLSFGCVCSMKMRVSLVVFDKNQLIFVDALGKHPLCHRMCKVTKETSVANKIMRNVIDSTSITFRWTSSSSR